MRWHYRDALLVWLMPIAYALHIVEEWYGGFPEWFALVIGSPLPRESFIAINAAAFAAMLAAAHAATRKETNGWMAVAIATILLVNGVAHIAGTLVTRSYSAGLFTSIVLYLPIAQLVLFRAWSQAEGPAFGRGVAAGVALHAIVVALAWFASL
jgi:hypothetical protein